MFQPIASSYYDIGMISTEKVVASNAANVEISPPPRTINAPNGKNDSAAFIIPRSPNWPIYFQAGIPLLGLIPPMDTKATRQYIITTIAIEIKIALGIFFLGFFTSSPVRTIISYPSKAIKVKPIVATRPPTPFGKKSAKFLVQSG